MLSLPCDCGPWMMAIASSRLKCAEGNGCAEARDTRHQAKVTAPLTELLSTTTTFATVVSADVDTLKATHHVVPETTTGLAINKPRVEASSVNFSQPTAPRP